MYSSNIVDGLLYHSNIIKMHELVFFCFLFFFWFPFNNIFLEIFKKSIILKIRIIQVILIKTHGLAFNILRKLLNII